MNIYAKSNGETLVDHTENALSVFESIKRILPYVPQLCSVDDFWKHLFLGVFFHDFGKVATGFQTSLSGQKWDYRHEILSAGLFLNTPLPDKYNMAISLAIISHHHGCDYLSKKYRTYGIGSNATKQRWQEKVNEMEQNQEYLYFLMSKMPEWSAKYLGEEITIPLDVTNVRNCKDSIELCVRIIKNYEEQEVFVSSFPDKNYLLFLRGLIIACDHLSSAGKEEILPAIQNIHEKLKIAGRIKELRGFQREIMNTSSSAYLAAPTGIGKTDAALLWSAKNQDLGRRIFYVLPYTASINAMEREFKRIFQDEEEKIGMLHHKADYLIYRSFLEQDYSTEESLKLMKETKSITKKIYRPIKILTPYQIIKAFYGVKGFEVMLSEMAGGLFVFDEIHCYDPRTVALIVRSIEELYKIGAKFLFMSATLPRFLRELISKSIIDITSITLNPAEKNEKEFIEQARHKVSLIEGEIVEYLDELKKQLNKSKRVLVVCNTVKRAQEIYQELKSYAKFPLLIHGRFIAADRERIEKELSSASLLVGTQAIEVSLNISFDTIFTEPAPIDAILQRFGRVNRFGKEPVPVYVFKKGSDADEFIYIDQSRVRKTLEILPNGEPLTNQRASELVEEVYANGYNEKEMKEYTQAYRDYDFVIRHLPIFDESEFKEDFFDLIKSKEVVPIKFRERYLELKQEYKYFEAMGYVVPISIRQYYRLLKESRVSRDSFDLFVDAKYDKELGLLLDENEVDVPSTII
jgi:CRISPR-associated endonuclease/helicase Cas3